MSRSTQRPARLTTTSYAILGLLAVRPWSTYELATQMDRSVGRYWPRARSKLYEEPKKLVGLGLAAAESQSVGLRPRTVYRITDQGRRVLGDWHHEAGQGPVLEFEQAAEARLRGERHEGRRPGPADRRPGLGLRTEPGEPRGRPRVRR